MKEKPTTKIPERTQEDVKKDIYKTIRLLKKQTDLLNILTQLYLDIKEAKKRKRESEENGSGLNGTYF